MAETKIIYRVYAEAPASVYAEFESKEEAEAFREEEYHGPIEVLEAGEVVGFF